jgi:hypothetical protein
MKMQKEPVMQRANQRIEVLDCHEFRHDAVLRALMIELAAPSYEDPVALLSRDLQRCDTLYLASDVKGDLVAFFMVAHEMLALNNQQRIPTIYLGLSATRQDTKNTGRIMALYGRCMLDAMNWQQEVGQDILLWATTATPTIYLAARTLCQDVNPRLDGTYSAESAQIAQALRRAFGYDLPHMDIHPFVLKGVAHRTRYSATEVARNTKIMIRKGFSLFEDLGIDEAQGDRLLFTLRLPREVPPALSRRHPKEAINA